MIGKFECTWSKDQSEVNITCSYLSGVRSLHYLIISVNTGDHTRLQAVMCIGHLCAFLCVTKTVPEWPDPPSACW